ncbi:PilT/PilU family type 4a pilus ATPase [bacterium]|nr:PilT/PilU family type 4a pilus ATPase [bacterium]
MVEKNNEPSSKEFFEEILSASVDVGASDIHLKVGLPPVVRYKRELRVLSKKKHTFRTKELEDLIRTLIPERHLASFEKSQEVDFAYSFSGVGRFRVNVYRHRGNPAMAIRYIPFDVQTIDQLGLPSILKKLSLKRKGLVLITGTAGSGKSTTLAAMIQEWNRQRSGHIITIEDPIEYLIRDKKALITQREIGVDTQDYLSGLKSSLRQDPDVIMIGELRDVESISQALSAAETGHLVLATLHTRDATETLSRLIGVFPPESREQVRWQLSASLEAVVCQKLVPSEEGKMIPISEILINTPRVKECLSDPTKTQSVYEAIEKGSIYQMQTFDQALMAAHAAGKIKREQVLEYASRPADLELQLRGIGPTAMRNKDASIRPEHTHGSVEIDFPGRGKK